MLEALKLKKFQNLESITTPEEIGATLALESLRSLTLTDCNNLRSLPQHMHRLLPSLADLEIDGCPEIESFPQGGLPSKLEGLRIRNCSKLLAQHGHWDFEGLNSLKTLRIGDCDVVLDSFPAGSLPAASLTLLFLRNLSGLQSLNGSAFKKVTSLYKLWLSNCKELQYLPEQVLRPTFLSCLWIEECPILERRYRKEKGEDWDKISHIPQILLG
ncbi:LRR domain containing protein [Parasponia andersonii]|uniref:LRR domain containing protein n=1 Tax=Parasponia andersonii TaxID=3476 RepID=A0A2P5DM71_PARAD|nr:LRR domain containing protein [Parasponia andersonii]